MNFGYATIQIIPSLKGAKSNIEHELGGVDATKSGKSIGQTITSGIGSVMKGAAATTVGAAAAGIGTALVKGFSRLNQLDQARQKLTGLGNDANTVEQIIGKNGDAMKAVTGTAFGLGEAATVAASAVAANVKPGEDLQKMLGLVADAATIAGTDMGSMGAIFNKVAASNRLTLGVVNQLQTAGIPALQLVADQMGITAEEASAMVSSGQVDFATFQAAMESGLGGAAQASGDTFTGAMKNIGAALGRVGEAFLGGIFPKMAPLFQKVSAALGPVTEKAGELGEKIADYLNPAIEKIGDLLSNDLEPGLEKAKTLLGPAVAAFVALGASGLAPLIKMVPGLGGLAKNVGLLASPLGIATAAFLGLAAVSPELRDSLGGLFSALGDVATTLGPALEDIGSVLGAVVTVALQAFANTLGVVVDAAAGFLEWLAPQEDLLRGLATAITIAVAAWGSYQAVSKGIDLGKKAVDIAKTTIAWGKNTAALIANKAETVALVAMYAKDMAIALAKNAAAAATSAARWAANTAAMIASKTAMLATKAAMGVATAAQWAWNAAMNANPIMLVVTAIAALVAGLVWFFTQTELGQEIWANFTKWLGEAWDNTVEWVLGIGDKFADWWNGLWTGVQEWAQQAWDGIVDLFQAALEWIVDLFMNWTVYGLIIQNWDEITQFFSDLWGGIVSFFQDALDWLVDLFMNWTVYGLIIQNWDEVKQFFADLWDGIVAFFQNALDWVVDLFMNWTVYGLIIQNWDAIKQFFVDVWSGIVSGVKSAIGKVSSIVQSVTKTISTIWRGAWNGISSFFTGIWNGIVSTVTKLKTTFSNVFGGIKGLVKSAFSGVLGAVKAPINGIIGLVNKAVGALNSISVTIPDWVPLVGGQTWGLSLPTLPKLAKGATILPRPGGTAFIGGEAGRAESVVDEGHMNALIQETRRMISEANTKGNTVNQYIRTEQTDPTLQMRQWGREAQRGLASTP